MAHHPEVVTFTDRSVASTTMLEELSFRQDSNDFWLLHSGLKGGDIFSKSSDSWQLLNGTKLLGAPQRIGKQDDDKFFVILGDSP